MNTIRENDRSDEELHDLVNQYFSQNKRDFVRKNDYIQTAKDEAALKQFLDTIVYVPNGSGIKDAPPGRYAVMLPWRPNCPELPNNFGLIIDRLRSTLRRLRRDQSC